MTRGTVTLADLHFAAAELLTGADGTADEIVSDFQLRWQEILLTQCADSSTGEIQVPLHHAAAMVAALFPADRPGWAAARNHSPDLLLARTDDGYRWVLGELHVAMNTMESRFFHDMCDEPTALLGQAARDFESGRVVPCYPTGLTFVEAVTAGMVLLHAPLHVAHPAAFAATAVLTLLSVVATGALLAPLFLASRISLLFEIVLAYPFYILGAVMFPVSELPGWTQGISNVIFLRWCTDLMRDSLRPGEVPDLAGGLLALVVIATVSYALGVAMLHRITGRLRRLGSTEEV